MSFLLLLLIYTSFISLGLPDSLLGSAWPSISGGLSVPTSYAGILSMVIAGGTVLSSVFSERLIRRFETGWVTVVSVFMTAVALFAFSCSDSFAALCFWAVPLGLGAGSVDVALNNFVALHYKAKHMSWLHCFWGIGATTGPVILSQILLNGGSWQSGYRTISLLQAGLVVLLFVSVPLWKKVGGQEAAPVQGRTASLKPGELLRIPGAKPALLTFFCYCAIEQTAGLWGSSYLVLVKKISPETAAKWISLFYGGITFGRLASGFLSAKLNHRRIIRLGQGVFACGIFSLLLPFGALPLRVGFLLLGLGSAPIYPSLLHETPLNFGREDSQAIMGIQMACAYTGTIVMPPLFGLVATHVSYRLFPVYLGGLLLMMVAAREKLNRTVDGIR